MTFSLEPLRRNLEGLVHESVAGDAQQAVRHRDFIAVHLVAGLLSLLVLTVFLAVVGPPPLATALAFLWLAAPLPIAAYLSRTGRFGRAHLLSAAAVSGFLAYVATWTGGSASPFLVWLVIVPAEAALSGSSRVTALAASFAALALAIVAGLDGLHAFAQPFVPGFLLSVAVLAGALLYAAGLAIRIGRLCARTERQARDGESRYRLLAENATDLITRHNLSGDVEFASPAARGIAGCAPSELLGDGLFHRVHVADRPAFLHALSEADRTGKPVAAEFRFRRGDLAGTPAFAWLEMHCRPAIDPVDAGRTLVAVTRDVTARKEYEAAIEEARTEAERANRAKGQFLANMSHELREPLNAIIGFADMMRDDPQGRFAVDRHREYARLIHASGEHLLEVVNSVLDMSRLDAGRLELAKDSFALASVVDASIDMLSQQIANRGLTLVRQIQSGLPDIVADRRACRQILLNLISNAVKFTNPPGRIVVAVRQERDMFVLEVSDNGIGIASTDLPRLGTPFTQVDVSQERRHEGTGLGLSVVKGLVALHGGTLAIASTLGQGTTVTIRLPAPAANLVQVPVEQERRIA